MIDCSVTIFGSNRFTEYQKSKHSKFYFMKKSTLLLLLTSLCLTRLSSAQNLIAVQHGSSQSFYSDLSTAISVSVNGDTLYLPGSSYTLGSLVINKRIHIVGAGHNPDSTLATGKTTLTGSIYLVTGADSGSISGILLNGSIYVGTGSSNQDVHSFLIERCNFVSLVFSFYSPYTVNNSSGFLVKENVINGAIDAGLSESNVFQSNIIAAYITQFKNNNILRNNIFLYNGGTLLINITGCLFENNVILNTYGTFYSSSYSNAFNNNVFVGAPGLPGSSNGNYLNQAQNSIFTSQSGNSFSYSHNYRIKSTSPGYNGGVDGKDVGIYGGAFPWKEGSAPFNPHIQYQSISGTTDAGGNLNVNIKVAAQGN